VDCGERFATLEMPVSELDKQLTPRQVVAVEELLRAFLHEQ